GTALSGRFHARVTWLDARGRPLAGGKTARGAGERPYPLAFIARAPEATWQRAVFVSSYENPAGDEAPAGAAFARIAFLLQGPGRVDIDSVRFSYARRNLALSERLDRYRTQDDDALGRVTPTPRSLAERGPEISFRRLCLRHAGDPPAGLAERIKAFEERLNALGATLVRSGKGTARTGACDLTLALARADDKRVAGLREEARTLPPEGYLIHTHAGPDGPPVLYGVGADNAGVVYALETLRQLLRPGAEGAAALRAVEVRDWPAFHGRSLAAWEPGVRGLRTIVAASRWITGVKLNRLYLNYPLRSSRWWQPPDAYRGLVAGLGRHAARTGLYDLGVLVNPYVQRSEPEITDTFQISRPEDVDILWSEIARAADAGAKIVMLCLDDFLPARSGRRFAYYLEDARDRSRFKSLAEAHLWLVDTLRARLRARAPGVRLVLVPPWYNERFREEGGSEATRYMRDIGRALPEDVGLVWTGPTVRSRIVDDVSTAGFSGAAGGRPLLLWDNSVWELELSPYYAGSPDRADLVSLFEPFQIETENLSATSFRGEFYFNGSSGGRFLAKAMTLADFLWNPGAYDPDRSIWRAMVARWGRDTAGLLLDWDTAYWQERVWINRLAAGSGKPSRTLLENLRAAGARHAALWKAVRIALAGKHETLRRELEAWVDAQQALREKARGIAPAKP
ncbi:MAG: beta-N-acetylglucosaminidase domain-containing protein, partial [Myxococcota bacterium]